MFPARHPTRPDPLRRRFLAALALAASARLVPLRADEPDAIAGRARQAGLGPLRSKSSERYLVIGDAPEGFLAQALDLCDRLARDYLDHFRKKGFAVEPPRGRLTVVVLSGPDAYAAYLGLPPGQADGGHYEPETNRLVMFDNRARSGGSPGLARANTIALMHEATHQLAFNTGLLDRRADVPGWLNEGLAMYAEVRSPTDARRRIGTRNDERLIVLREAGAAGSWPRVADLFASDAPLDDASTEQAAYALSWLLVYHLMQSPERLPRFREYVDVVRGRRDPTHRAADAREFLGDPDELDAELERTAARLAARAR
jgi:hypothetical protein